MNTQQKKAHRLIDDCYGDRHSLAILMWKLRSNEKVAREYNMKYGLSINRKKRPISKIIRELYKKDDSFNKK